MIKALKEKAISNGNGDSPGENEASQILEELKSSLWEAAAFCGPNISGDQGEFSKHVAKITTEMLKIRKVCDANVYNGTSDEWQTATISERVQQVVGDLKRKIKSSEASNGDVDDASNLAFLEVLLDPEGDLSNVPELKHVDPEAVKELRRVINDIQRTADNVKAVMGDEELASQMSVADQIQLIIVETILRGKILEDCEKVVEQQIGRDKDGGSSRLAQKIQFIITDFVVTTKDINEIGKVVGEATANDESVSKMPLTDKVNVIIAENYAQAEELTKIENVVHEITGKDELISRFALPDKITAIVADNFANVEELSKYGKMIKSIGEQVNHLKAGDVEHKLRDIMKSE